MKKIAFISLVTLLLFTSFTSEQDDTNAKIKTVFLYNFTKYIEWPPAYKEGNFVITIVGNNATLTTELTKMATAKMADKQKFEIKTVSSLSEVGKCNILFVTSDSKANVVDVIQKIKGTSTLLVTEKNGAAKQGSVINFVVQENKQKFELNKSNAEKFNLKVSSTLLSLAIEVK